MFLAGRKGLNEASNVYFFDGNSNIYCCELRRRIAEQLGESIPLGEDLLECFKHINDLQAHGDMLLETLFIAKDEIVESLVQVRNCLCDRKGEDACELVPENPLRSVSFLRRLCSISPPLLTSGSK